MGTRTSTLAGAALTAAAPASANDGVDITGATGMRVILKGNGGNLTGGKLRCYWYDPTEGWMRSPELDLTVDAGPNAKQVWPDLEIGVQNGRVAFVPNAVTLSAGTTVDVRIDVWGHQVP